MSSAPMSSALTRNGQTILELAICSKSSPSELIPSERTLLVIGNKNAGKTTLIHKFFDKNEKPKPTLALEYSFARRSGKSLTKDVCHVWELGSGLVFKDLLSVIVKKTQGLCVVLVLDLSRPESLWNAMETFLDEVKTHLENVTEIEGRNRIDLQNVEDKKYMSPMPVPLIIVGSKYDLYQNLEPAKKRVLCQSLRYVAHTYGASLLFCSANDPVLAKRSKEMMSHHGFGTACPKNCVQDWNKPLHVPAGRDCFDKIDDANDDRAGSIRSMHKYKNAFATHFKQTALDLDENAPSAQNIDPLVDSNYADPLIDESLKKKQEELKIFVDTYERFLNTENTKHTS